MFSIFYILFSLCLVFESVDKIKTHVFRVCSFQSFFNPINLLPSGGKNGWMSVNLNRIDIKKIARLWCLPFCFLCPGMWSFLVLPRLMLVPMESETRKELSSLLFIKVCLNFVPFLQNFL